MTLGRRLDVNLHDLTDAQLCGIACYRCATPLTLHTRRWAGWAGQPQHQLYVCPQYPRCRPGQPDG